MAANIRFQLLPDGRAIWQQPLDNSHNNTLTPGLQEGDLTALARQLRGQRSMLVYPGEQVHCLSLQAPSRRRSAWLQALPFALEDQIAQELETSHLAVGKFSAQHRLAVAVVQREALHQMLDELAQYGITPTLIVPDFLLLPYQEGQWTVHLDTARALVRCSVDAGFACEADNLPLWLAKAFADAPPEQQPEQLRLFSREPQKVEDWLKQNTELAQPLSLQTEPFTPLLQLASTAPSTSLNLRQGEFGPQSAARQHWRQWRGAAILAALCLLAVSARDAWEWYQLNTEQTRLRTAIEQTFRQILPTARLVNPRVQLASYLRQSDVSGTESSTGFLPLLGVAASTLSEFPALRLRGLSFRQNQLELDLRGGTLEHLDALKNKLAERTDVNAEISASMRDGQVLGRVSLRFVQEGGA